MSDKCERAIIFIGANYWTYKRAQVQQGGIPFRVLWFQLIPPKVFSIYMEAIFGSIFFAVSLNFEFLSARSVRFVCVCRPIEFAISREIPAEFLWRSRGANFKHSRGN